MHFSGIPLEIFFHDILPAAQVRDILNLGCTSRFFVEVCSDDVLWKERCEVDFPAQMKSQALSSRRKRWKVQYRALSFPKVFVWGHLANGRRGTADFRSDGYDSFPCPVEVKLPRVQIVSMKAGGWCFSALDSKGNVYVWGALREGGIYGMETTGRFTYGFEKALVPHKLDMPNPIRMVSCGRAHMAVLDSEGQVWTFLAWGMPFKLRSSLLGCHSPSSTPSRIACGWVFTAILTEYGNVLAFWPYAINTLHLGTSYASWAEEIPKDRRIICVTRDIITNPFRLPELPALPKFNSFGVSEGLEDVGITLVEIAALEDQLIGLTNKGHVLKFNDMRDPGSLQLSQAGWEYLPNFSEPSRIQQYTSTGKGDTQSASLPRITHIVAQYQSFVAYSTGQGSVALVGSVITHRDSPPVVLPGMQNRSIASVTLGDNHGAVLTTDGELLTWGGYMRGALGLGDPMVLPVGVPGGYADEEGRQHFVQTGAPIELPNVIVPTQVHFDHREDCGARNLCVSTTASGWHTGALVVDLEPEQ